MADSLYVPSKEILRRYAEVLVKFALNSGQGVKPGEVVEVVVPDAAKALALELHNVILEVGAHPMIRLTPTGFEQDFFSRANDEQLTFFPEKFLKARVDILDHHIGVIADVDPYELRDVDPAKLIKSRDARKAYRDWFVEKEVAGKLTWTLALWGVEAKAALVELSIEEYWEQIIKACYLDYDDPVKKWQEVFAFQEAIKKELNQMSIEWVKVKGADADLTLKLGADRIWQGGSGRNIPSFEFFTSPDWRGTEGWIRFNQPVYRYGQVMKNIYLKFEKGLVVHGEAEVGNDLLQEMLKSSNADKVGEFSLTDRRMSRITHTMAETLFDENIGGPFGNTHLAVGMAYKDCYRGNAAQLSKKDWDARGFNDSAEHTDIISTTDRTVTATLTGGQEVVIYQDGQFQVGTEITL